MAKLRQHVEEDARAVAVTFLGDGAGENAELTYGCLFRQANAFAGYLRAEGLSGARIVLALPSGPDFIVAFAACLLAGAVAVPSPPLRKRDTRTWERLEGIARDSEAAAVIASPELCAARLRPELGHLSVARMVWISPPQPNIEQCDRDVPASTQGNAFIQYTSGSTSAPKGVVVSHANLEANLLALGKKLRVSRESVVVSWLPPHHDWGLVGVVLAGLYYGNRLVLIDPLHFAQKPLRWLSAISSFRGTHTGAPNFAYELCVKRIADADLETLDLQSLEVAGCGAEPIRPRAVENFCSKFSRAGFRSQSFYPCYGLAEATLLVTGSDLPRPPMILQVEQHQSEIGETVMMGSPNGRRIVSCGSPSTGHDLAIVDPVRLTVCSEDRVGEVWFRGPSVTAGYWSKTSPHIAAPKAVTAEGQGGFLRTGDLGFLHEGDLYLVGRLKDVIIANGRKLHPQDIEWTATGLQTSAVLGRAAAFSYGDFDDSRFAVVVEVQSARSEAVAELPQKLFADIVRAHEVAPKCVAVVKAGALPLTTSGKIRRGQARDMLLNGEFGILAEYLAQ